MKRTQARNTELNVELSIPSLTEGIVKMIRS